MEILRRVWSASGACMSRADFCKGWQLSKFHNSVSCSVRYVLNPSSNEFKSQINTSFFQLLVCWALFERLRIIGTNALSSESVKVYKAISSSLLVDLLPFKNLQHVAVHTSRVHPSDNTKQRKNYIKTKIYYRPDVHTARFQLSFCLVEWNQNTSSAWEITH